MKLMLTIDTNNDAYVGDLAALTVADRLKQIARRIQDGHTEGVILDGVNNSARIGSWKYTPEADDEQSAPFKGSGRIAYHADESYVHPAYRALRFVVIEVHEGKPGYLIMPNLNFLTVEAAQVAAKQMNDNAGLSADDVLNIRMSSMAASRRIGD